MAARGGVVSGQTQGQGSPPRTFSKWKRMAGERRILGLKTPLMSICCDRKIFRRGFTLAHPCLHLSASFCRTQHFNGTRNDCLSMSYIQTFSPNKLWLFHKPKGIHTTHGSAATSSSSTNMMHVCVSSTTMMVLSFPHHHFSCCLITRMGKTVEL